MMRTENPPASATPVSAAPAEQAGAQAAKSSGTKDMFVASTTSGVVQATAFNVFNVLQVNAQVGQANRPLGTLLAGLSTKTAFQGMPLNVATCMVRNGSTYTTHHVLMMRLDVEAPSVRSVMSGCAAGAVDALLSTPGRRVMLLQQSPNHDFENAVSAARHIYDIEGKGGLWRGLAITSMRNAAASGVYFGLLTELNRLHRKVALAHPDRLDSELGPGDRLAIGVIAGVGSVLASNPLDVVKARAQDDIGGHRFSAAIARDIYLSEGFRGFTRGALINALRIGPAVGIGYLVTERMRSWLAVEA